MQKEAGTNENRSEPGVIVEVLPKALYRVRLDGGRHVRAGLTGTSRHGIVRLVAGDQVEVKVSSHDPSRAMIIRKLA